MPAAVKASRHATNCSPAASILLPTPGLRVRFSESTAKRRSSYSKRATRCALPETPPPKSTPPLQSAEEAYAQKRDRKTVEAAARDVVQTAEEARVIAVKAKSEEEAQAKVAAEKRAAEEREAKARADAD